MNWKINQNSYYISYTYFCSQTLVNYLAFQSFDFERTWWRLFQKSVVYSEFDIYVFIIWLKQNGDLFTLGIPQTLFISLDVHG
jgi:hypothetical protein